MEFFRYDRWDNLICVLNDVTAAYHYQEAGGENSLTITTKTPLAKGDRIVWCDEGTWREHVVNEPKDVRGSDGTLLCTSYCEDAMCELTRDKVDEKRIRSGTSGSAIEAVLEQTRWELGETDVTALRTKSFYHCSVGEGLSAIAETWGGEIYSSFEVDESGITARKVNHVSAMGDALSNKRFEYGKDLVSITRKVAADDVYTAMRGYGMGELIEEGEWGRRITFEEINGGKDYVEDAEALALWGRPDGSGGMAHAFGTVIFDDCEDPAELMELTQQELDGCKEPKVSYECSVLDLKGMGYDFEGVGIGDAVALIDPTFTPTLRLRARVMAMKRNLLEPSDVKVTIGNVQGDIARAAAEQKGKLDSLTRKSSAWDVAALTPPSYLEQVVSGLNAQFDAGGAYKYESFEIGTIYSSVPLDDEFKPVSTPASAIQLKGGGFRIANTVSADGSFNWRAFGTGDGFTADEITAGTIKGGASYWNLETGDFKAVNADLSGKVTADSGNIGGFDIEAERMVSEGVTLGKESVGFRTGGVLAGLIGASSYASDETKRGVIMSAAEDAEFLGLGAVNPDTGNVSAKLRWDRTSDQVNVYRPLNVNDWVIYGGWIDPETGGCNGGINAEINFCQITKASWNGSSWDVTQLGTDAKFVFKHGMLVDVYYYNAT